jgi:hypothetical protein
MFIRISSSPVLGSVWGIRSQIIVAGLGRINVSIAREGNRVADFRHVSVEKNLLRRCHGATPILAILSHRENLINSRNVAICSLH